MHKYVRKNQEIFNNLKRIRLIKEDLAKVSNLVERSIMLIHGNIILENHTISYYNIPNDESIWFGLIPEYMDEFGCHVIIEFKQEDSEQSINVCEKLLIKKDETISKVRSSMARLYSWIGKVPLWNKMNQELLDDQTVEHCGLVDYPIIFLRPARVVITMGTKPEQGDSVSDGDSNVEGYDEYPLDAFFNIFESLRNNFTQLIPIMQFLRQVSDNTGNESSPEWLSKALDFITYFDKYEKHEISDDELNSFFMNPFKDSSSVELVTWRQCEEYLQIFIKNTKETMKDDDDVMEFLKHFDLFLGFLNSILDELAIDPDAIFGNLSILKLADKCFHNFVCDK